MDGMCALPAYPMRAPYRYGRGVPHGPVYGRVPRVVGVLVCSMVVARDGYDPATRVVEFSALRGLLDRCGGLYRGGNTRRAADLMARGWALSSFRAGDAEARLCDGMLLDPDVPPDERWLRLSPACVDMIRATARPFPLDALAHANAGALDLMALASAFAPGRSRLLVPYGEFRVLLPSNAWRMMRMPDLSGVCREVNGLQDRWRLRAGVRGLSVVGSRGGRCGRVVLDGGMVPGVFVA